MVKQKSGISTLLLVFLLVNQQQYAAALQPISKEGVFFDALLNEILNRMDKDGSDSNNAYYDLDLDIPKNMDLTARSSKSNPAEEFKYRQIYGAAASPALRDQEFIQHNPVWGHKYVSGGMGEAPTGYNTIVKTDASLPAYCNPPNPCPFGYDESQGCISEFENTAIFSREFQAAQECTCDNEHMFDCAGQDAGGNSDEMSSTLEILLHQFGNQIGNDMENTNAVVKKFYNFDKHEDRNPYLAGEKLPIAAKKGDHIHV